MNHTSNPTFNIAGLFTPGRLGPYTLPHRLLIAPMTRNRARRDGVPSPSALIYYAQRARVALIVAGRFQPANRCVRWIGGNRVRLLLQVTEAVADVWGADRVGVRISPLIAF